jgi:hypothetical protein
VLHCTLNYKTFTLGNAYDMSFCSSAPQADCINIHIFLCTFCTMTITVQLGQSSIKHHGFCSGQTHIALLLVGQRGYTALLDQRKYAGAAKPPPRPYENSVYLAYTEHRRGATDWSAAAAPAPAH